MLYEPNGPQNNACFHQDSACSKVMKGRTVHAK